MEEILNLAEELKLFFTDLGYYLGKNFTFHFYALKKVNPPLLLLFTNKEAKCQEN